MNESPSRATYPATVIAKLLMLTEQRIYQLVKRGVIPRAERGRYELVAAVQGYVKFLKDRAIGADIPGDAGGEHKVRLLKARADIAEMEAERMSGALIPADDVTKTWVAAVARCRARLLAIPTKAAALVATETETDACFQIIETFVHEALAELAATRIEIDRTPGDRGAADGDVPGVGAAAETDGEPVGGQVSEAVAGG